MKLECIEFSLVW